MTTPAADSAALLVRRADVRDLDALTPLFDAYRRFYEQPPDPAGARAFLRDRLERGESVVLLATVAGGAVGFAQLYPSFSSVAMAAIVVLNDLFVDPAVRRRGVAQRLLRAAIDHAREAGARRVELSTAATNQPARTLYLAHGFVVERGFDHMSLSLHD